MQLRTSCDGLEFLELEEAGRVECGEFTEPNEDPDAKGFYLYQYAKRDTSLSREAIQEIRSPGYPTDVSMGDAGSNHGGVTSNV